jgi:hypothetical protein
VNFLRFWLRVKRRRLIAASYASPAFRSALILAEEPASVMQKKEQ